LKKGVKMENAIRITIISVIVVYVILTLYHLSNGFDFGSALGAYSLTSECCLSVLGSGAR